MLSVYFIKTVESIRNVEKVLGIVDYSMTEKKRKTDIFSLAFCCPSIKADDVITKENIRSVRPSIGLVINS